MDEVRPTCSQDMPQAQIHTTRTNNYWQQQTVSAQNPDGSRSKIKASHKTLLAFKHSRQEIDVPRDIGGAHVFEHLHIHILRTKRSLDFMHSLYLRHRTMYILPSGQ